jgi:hypothetical protein
LRNLPVTVLRGSTSMLPVRDGSFDAAIAFHYLHEVDPFFHSNIVSELGRAGKRCIIVEPAPPSDPLGLRIAALYSRAKRELGQFENYHHLDYWRKLVAIVKPDVAYQTFSFMRRPPREAIRETVALIIDTMAAEQTPESYLDELRALAKRPDAQLIPQSRYVVVGTAPGERATSGAGTQYRERRPDDPRPGVIVSPFIPRTAERRPLAPAAVAASAEKPPVTPRRADPTTKPEGTKPAAKPAAAKAPNVARNAFGLPANDDRDAARPPTAPSVRGEESADAFGINAEAENAAAEFGWEWETPGQK